MPNWKKVIISGSNVSQLNNDGVYLKTIGGGILSSSAQIATQISGAFTQASGGFSTRIATLEGASAVSTQQVSLLSAADVITPFAGATEILTTAHYFNVSSSFTTLTFVNAFATGSNIEYNYVVRNGSNLGRMGTIKVISAFANYPNGEISHFETSTPDIDPVDAPTTNLVFSFDSSGTHPTTGRFLVQNTTGVNLILSFERKEWIIQY